MTLYFNVDENIYFLPATSEELRNHIQLEPQEILRVKNMSPELQCIALVSERFQQLTNEDHSEKYIVPVFLCGLDKTIQFDYLVITYLNKCELNETVEIDRPLQLWNRNTDCMEKIIVMNALFNAIQYTESENQDDESRFQVSIIYPIKFKKQVSFLNHLLLAFGMKSSGEQRTTYFDTSLKYIHRIKYPLERKINGNLCIYFSEISIYESEYIDIKPFISNIYEIEDKALIEVIYDMKTFEVVELIFIKSFKDTMYHFIKNVDIFIRKIDDFLFPDTLLR